MIKAIIFDFDGVLGDTFALNYKIVKEFDKEATIQDYIDHHKGNVYKTPMVKINDVDLFFKKQKQRFSHGDFFPLRSIINELAEKYKLYVVSSVSEDNLKRFLDMGEMVDSFQEVLGYETEKSKVKKFNLLFDKHHVRPDECLFVTDTLGDLKEAMRVRVRCIAVTWGYHNRKLLIKGAPAKIINKYSELIPAIEELGR